MPLHPAPPADLPGLVDAYAHTVRCIIDLGASCREADFEKDTACPGWSVKDQISHVAGLESWLGGGEVPRVRLPDYDHLHHDQGRFLELAVEARRGTPGPEVVDELEGLLAQRVAQFGAPGMEWDTTIKGPFGPAPVGRVLQIRILDIWTHEQDIREALGRPGNLDSPAAAVVVSLLFESLPKLIGHDIDVDPGQIVIFDVTGPVVGRAGVRVEAGEDGKRVGTPLFTGIAHEPHEGETTTSITLSTQALTRRAAGRGSVDDIHYTVHGDEALARRVLEGIVLVS